MRGIKRLGQVFLGEGKISSKTNFIFNIVKGGGERGGAIAFLFCPAMVDNKLCVCFLLRQSFHTREIFSHVVVDLSFTHQWQ
jgi:hypothetical protein